MNPRDHKRTAMLASILILLCLVTPASGQPVSLRLLVPAYANPCCDGGPDMWSQLIETALVMGDDVYLILNPDSGPGMVTEIDPNFVNELGQGPLIDYRNAGGAAIGYVATGYAMRSLSEVEAEIDLYYDPAYWRGAGVQIQGIFFDEMSNDLAEVGYYQSLRDHVRGHDAGARVVGNPGTSFTNNPSGQMTWTVDDYAESVDTLMTFEAGADEYGAAYSPPSWLASYPADRFAHIVHSEPSASDMVSDLSLAIARKAGYIYVTDDVPGAVDNPYDLIPTYWTREVEAAIGLVFADGFEFGDTSVWSTTVN